jgi:hypothetical protein
VQEDKTILSISIFNIKSTGKIFKMMKRRRAFYNKDALAKGLATANGYHTHLKP